MKDNVRKVISSLLSLGGLATIGIYMYLGASLVKEYVIQYNYYILAAIFFLFIYFFLQYGIVVLSGKKLKIKAVIAGLLTVLVGYYFINNDANNSIFAGDIISILGVLMIYLSLAGLIVTKKAEKKIAEKKQVIIEV